MKKNYLEYFHLSNQYQTNLGKCNIFFFSTGNFEVNSEEGFNESNVQFKYHYLHHHLNSKYPQKLYDEFFFLQV